MKINKLIVLGCGCVAICLFAGYYIFSTLGNKPNNEVRIGVILPLSGPQAVFGEDAMLAMKIAAECVNKGVNKKAPLRLQFEDGKYTSKDTLAAYEKLRISNVRGIVVFGDVPIFTLASYVERDKCPCIAHVASGQNITKLSEWVFRGWFSTEQIVLSMMEHLKKHSENYSVLSIRNNAGDEFSRLMEELCSKENICCLGKETFDMMDSDMRPQIEKILAKDPKHVAVLGFGPAYVTLINQLTTLKYTGDILTDVCAAHRSYSDGIKPGANVYYTDCALNSLSPDDVYFLEQYQKRSGHKVELFSAFAYLNIRLLFDAIDKSDGTASSVRHCLESVQDCDTIVGKVSFLPDHNMRMPLKLHFLKEK